MPSRSEWRRRLTAGLAPVVDWRSWWNPYRVAVAAIFAFFALACFREIANWWQFGHNGYNGSTYLQAAVNSVRFGLWGQVKYYYGLDAPSTDRYFVNHPLLLHVHLVPMVAAFGREAWVGRLVPALYSIASLGMLFAILRHLYGRWEALLGSLIFVMLPINLVYANMIDHEQGAIFSCLLSLYLYIRWRETSEWKFFWGVMAAFSMAVQWEWVGYYLAFFVVVHAFACGLRRDRPFRWHREYTFVVVFSAVILGNAAFFFGYAYVMHGDLQALFGAFDKRTSDPSGYWSTIWNYAKVHYGTLPFYLFGGWFVYFGFRLIRGELELRDLLPLCFFLIQAVHSTVFKQAGQIHSYWIYYLGVAFAAGGAEVLAGIRQWFRRPASWVVERLRPGDDGARSSARPAIQTVLFFAVLSLPLAVQADFTVQAWNKGVAKAGIPKYDGYDPMTDDAIWADAVSDDFPRESTTFVLHRALSYRTEVKYYLDTPFEHRGSLRPPAKPRSGERNHVFLVDLKKVSNRERLNALVQNYRAILYNRRYLAVNLNDEGGPFEAKVRVERPPSLLWSWFVNGRVSPGTWEPDPVVEEVDDYFPHPLEVADTVSAGGSGGSPFEWYCPKRSSLRGLEFVSNDDFTGTVSGLRPICGRPDAGTDGLFVGPTWGTQRPDARKRLLCERGQAVVGLHGRAGRLLDTLGITCGPAGSEAAAGGGEGSERDGRARSGDAGVGGPPDAGTAPRDTGSPNADAGPPSHDTDASDTGADASGPPPPARWQPDDTAKLRRLGPIGGSGGEPFDVNCPEGTYAVAFTGRSGAGIDRVGITCAN